MQPPLCLDQSPERVSARLRNTIDMHRAGVRMMHAKLRDAHPHESAHAIQTRLNQWLHGAPPESTEPSR
ncbi:MAG: hypothetical protein V3V20_12110 [Algisphaera sp.]